MTRATQSDWSALRASSAVSPRAAGGSCLLIHSVAVCIVCFQGRFRGYVSRKCAEAWLSASQVSALQPELSCSLCLALPLCLRFLKYQGAARNLPNNLFHLVPSWCVCVCGVDVRVRIPLKHQHAKQEHSARSTIALVRCVCVWERFWMAMLPSSVPYYCTIELSSLWFQCVLCVGDSGTSAWTRLSNTVTQLAPVGVWVMVRGSVLSHLWEKEQPWQL